MQMCAVAHTTAEPASSALFGCELHRAMRLNRAVLGEHAWASRAPLGVEALLAHLLAIDAVPGWAAALLEQDPMDSVDRKQLDRLVRSLNRIHRTRGQRRRTQQQTDGAAEAQKCREAVESTASRAFPGSVALCALIRFLEQLRTPLVNPEHMPRVLDHFRTAGPLCTMDMATRNSVCRGLHGHTQLGLLDDPMCRALVEHLAAFAHDFAVVHAANSGDEHAGGSVQRPPRTDSRILAQLSRILGPLVLRHTCADRDSNGAVVPVPGGEPTVAEACDIFHLMALETGFIFGDDPRPGGVGSNDGQKGGGKRRQHHRVNSWLTSQQLDPIHEELEILPQQTCQPQPEERSVDAATDEISYGNEPSSPSSRRRGDDWQRVVFGVIILTIVLLLGAVAAYWLAVPKSGDAQCASGLPQPLSSFSNFAFRQTSAASVPGQYYHYLTLQSWASDRAERISSIVQSTSRVLGTLLRGVRMAAYSCADVLLVSSPS